MRLRTSIRSRSTMRIKPTSGASNSTSHDPMFPAPAMSTRPRRTRSRSASGIPAGMYVFTRGELVSGDMSVLRFFFRIGRPGRFAGQRGGVPAKRTFGPVGPVLAIFRLMVRTPAPWSRAGDKLFPVEDVTAAHRAFGPALSFLQMEDRHLGR